MSVCPHKHPSVSNVLSTETCRVRAIRERSALWLQPKVQALPIIPSVINIQATKKVFSSQFFFPISKRDKNNGILTASALGALQPKFPAHFHAGICIFASQDQKQDSVVVSDHVGREFWINERYQSVKNSNCFEQSKTTSIGVKIFQLVTV